MIPNEDDLRDRDLETGVQPVVEPDREWQCPYCGSVQSGIEACCDCGWSGRCDNCGTEVTDLSPWPHACSDACARRLYEDGQADTAYDTIKETR